MSNQELITNTINPISLNPESSVKFDAKISTSDLIEAVLFEREEFLTNSLNSLEKEYKKLCEQQIDIEKKEVIITDKIIKLIPAKYNALLKNLEKFCGEKINIEREISNTTNTKIRIVTSMWNKNISINNTTEESIPKDLLEINKQLNILRTKISKNRDNMDNISNLMKQLPMIKKKIKTEFIKNVIRGDNLSAKDMLAKLKDAVLSYSTKDSNFITK